MVLAILDLTQCVHQSDKWPRSTLHNCKKNVKRV